MSELNVSILDRVHKPFMQGILVLALSVGTMTVAQLVALSGMIKVGTDFPWLCAAAFTLLFSMFNAIIAVSSNDIEIYFRQSLLSFIVLVGLSIFLATLFSGNWINDAGTYRTIFIILIIGYLALLSIGGLIKRISMILTKEEENYRRSRNKK